MKLSKNPTPEEIVKATKQEILKEGQKRIELEYFNADFDEEKLTFGGLVNHKSFDKEIDFDIFEKWMLANYNTFVMQFKFADFTEMEGEYRPYLRISWSDLLSELEMSIAKEFLQTIL